MNLWQRALRFVGLGALAGVSVANAQRQPGAAHLARMNSILARYENAIWTDENQRQWWMADLLSAKSANNFQVRRQLRFRSRQEVSNNPYLYGVCTGNADDLIGTGPTLQVLLSEAKAKQVERAFFEWYAEVDLTEKLRTCRLAETVDGEGFLVLRTAQTLEHSVKLYPCDIEADQVTTPAPVNLQELWIDGLILDKITQRPIGYTVLKTHPGDFYYPNMNPLEYERIKSRFVIHVFPKFRPGQVRGVPVFTPSLDLFQELRAYRKAVLTKAQLAAAFTIGLKTQAATDEDGTETPTPFENIPIDRGTMTVLPGGTEPFVYQSGEPATTYETYQEKCLGEAIRPLHYPLNLALGTSQRFNFSSARLDHINYRNQLNVERARYNRAVLDKLFAAWLEEAIMVPGLLPEGINSVLDVPHEWHWPGYEPLDPVQDATADHARLSNGTMTLQQFWASRGRPWREMLKQQAEEQREIERLGLVFGEPLKKTEKLDDTASAGKDSASVA